MGYEWANVLIGEAEDAPAGGRQLVDIAPDQTTIPTVTQATSITTGVTINGRMGQITTVSSTLAAAAEADFVVTNSEVKAGDIVVAGIKSTSSAGTPIVVVAAVADGSFTLRLTNLHAANALDNTLVIFFAVWKYKQFLQWLWRN